jgi:hypothetical protein
MGQAGPHGSKLTRRQILAGAAAVAGAALLPLPASARAAGQAEALIASLPRMRWDWTVERLALARINTDRSGALRLLWAAFTVDLDPATTWRPKRALRLYDLFATAATARQRRELAQLVLATPRAGAVLHERARLWSDPSRPPRRPLWRTTGSNGAPLGILITPA